MGITVITKLQNVMYRTESFFTSTDTIGNRIYKVEGGKSVTLKLLKQMSVPNLKELL